MAKRGRPNKYNTHVEPYLDKIKEMALTMTEKQIAQSLGVAYSSFMEYKKQYSELSESLKKGRQDLVINLKSALIKKALGFEYSEKKTIKENGIVVREEVTVKHTQPDVAALNLLLKNYDAEHWANDPQMLRIREKELELRERQMEKEEW